MRQPFGGMQISFKGRRETMEDVFGPRDLGPAEMTALLWRFIKRQGLVQPKGRTASGEAP
mgnify:CR=1 FL=1